MQDAQSTAGQEHHAAVSDVGTPQKHGVPRRTVVMGAAWSLPVIAAAISTPLASASTL